MQREIKFRAWNGQRMLFWENVYQASEFWDDVQYPVTLPVMQFTGLLDKNGKEIYEGDVLRMPLKYYRIEDVGMESHFIAQVAYNAPEFLAFNLEGDDHSLEDGSECEVIGNIYENPDLLQPPTEK